MVQNQNGQQPQQGQNQDSLDMFTWRLNKHHAEKHTEDVNRQILRQQSAA